MRMTFDEAVNRYGKIENGKWSDESKWMILYNLPDYIKVKNQFTGQYITHIYINKDCIESLSKVFDDLKNEGCLDELKTFSGCFMIRDVRGYPGRLSTHAFGTAIDWRADEMPLGSKSLFSDKFVSCWENNGWTWGGKFKRLDPQHFSYSFE